MTIKNKKQKPNSQSHENLNLWGRGYLLEKNLTYQTKLFPTNHEIPISYLSIAAQVSDVAYRPLVLIWYNGIATTYSFLKQIANPSFLVVLILEK